MHNVAFSKMLHMQHIYVGPIWIQKWCAWDSDGLMAWDLYGSSVMGPTESSHFEYKWAK